MKRRQVERGKPGSCIYSVFSLFSPTSPSHAPIGFLLFSALCFVSISCAKDRGSQKPQLIKAGESIESELPAGEKRSYLINCEKGAYTTIDLKYCGIDEEIKLFNPEGVQIAALYCRPNRSTPLSFISNNSGTHRIEIASPAKKTGGSRYGMTVSEIRPSTDEDRIRIAVERANADGDALRREETETSLRRAILKYEEAIRLLDNRENPAEKSYSYEAIGATRLALSDSDKARVALNESLRIAEAAGDARFLSEIHNDICSIERFLGNSDKALKESEIALELSKKTGNEHGEAQALGNLGECLYFTGLYRAALNHYSQSIPIWTRLRDLRGLASTLTYLGYTHSDLGEPERARENFDRALQLYEDLGDKRGMGATLTAIGRLHSRQGDNQKALECFDRAKSLIDPTGDKVLKAMILNGIAYINHTLGKHERAIDHYNQALVLFEAARLPLGEAQTHEDTGTAYMALNKTDEALACYRKALKLGRDIGNRRTVAYVLRDIGGVYEKIGKKLQALVHYTDSLAFFKAEKEYRGEAETLRMLGLFHLKNGDPLKAIESFRRTLSINEITGDDESASATFYDLAGAERKIGDLANARIHMENSLKKTESLRTRVALSGLRTSFMASVYERYDFYIDLLMQMHREKPQERFDANALQVFEQSRARSLLDLLAEAKANIRGGVSVSLERRLKDLHDQINDLELRRKELLSQGAQPNEINHIAQEINEQIEEIDAIEARIKTDNPRYGELANTSPLDLTEVQRLLDKETILLEYSLGNERSYLWSVTHDGIKSYQLPGRKEIEKLALPVYQYLSGERAESGSIKMSLEEDYWRRASSLSAMLLTPVSEQLCRKRLLYVPDGMLQSIPLQALPKPLIAGLINKRGRAKNSITIQSHRQLMLDHEIINLPSASTLEFLRGQTGAGPTVQKTAAVFADPVFEASDERVQIALNSKGPSLPDSKTRENADQDNLIRLPHTRIEASSIKRIVPSDLFNDWQGFDASPERAKSDILKNYRIVHFATHAIINNDHPELSAIVLSQFDKNGGKKNGHLMLHDIYNLKLAADLVVLSACKTGLGKEVRGEGLIGFTRGFMYAGSRRVMASLWEVEEKPTRELMSSFYSFHLKTNMNPSAALREAQISLFNQPEFASPYKWAGFILQGEYK